MQAFSVLMSVYRKEVPAYLSAALESVFRQTVLPAEVVLVEDGPLTDELYRVVDDFQRRYPTLKPVPLPRNVGLGRALNEGLRHCSCDLVARMDTDDLSRPDRFERQLHVMATMPEVDVCGSWINEFALSPDCPVSQRRTPETNEEIYRFGRQRNPMNHVTVMFRRQQVLCSGGYQDYPLFEDYFLWVRMLTQGCRFYSIQQPLVDVRADVGMIARRSGLRYALTEARLQFLFYGLRYIGFGTFLHNLAVRFTARMLPRRVRAWLYRKKLRSAQPA